jgi:hypothetical protein
MGLRGDAVRGRASAVSFVSRPAAVTARPVRAG